MDVSGSEFDPLMTHRFRLNEVSTVVLNRVKSTFTKFKLDYPDVVGLTIYGSQVKGVARGVDSPSGQSDVDLFLVLKGKEGQEPNVGINVVTEDSDVVIYDSFIEALAKGTDGNSPEFNGRALIVTKQRIDYELNELVKAENGKIQAGENVSGALSEYFSNLGYLFHLQIGKDLDQYRAYILNKLKVLGAMGDEIWRRSIISVANMMESGNIPRDIGIQRDLNRSFLYPQTVSDALRIYGLNQEISPSI